MHERIKWIDMARGYAIIIIVVVHIGLIPFTEFLQPIQLPLFAIITSLTLKDKFIFSKEVAKKIKDWLIPYLYIGLISFGIWNLLLNKYPPYNVLLYPLDKQLYNLLIGQNILFNGPLWFLPSFFIAVIIYYLVSSLGKYLQLFLSLFSLILGFLLSFFFPSIIFSLDLSFIFVSYLLITRNSYKLLMKNEIPSLSKIILIFVFFLFVTSANGVVSFYGRVFNNYILFLLSSYWGSFLIFVLAKQTALYKGFFPKVIEYIGKNTMSIYLSHWILLLLLISGLTNFTSFITILNASISGVNISLPHKYDIVSLAERSLLFLLLFTWSILVPLSLHKAFKKIVFILHSKNT